MRSVASAVAAIGLVLLVSCTDQPTEPSAPAVTLDPGASANTISPPGCPTVGQIAVQIAKLVKGPGHLLIAEAKFALVVVALAQHDEAKARRMMFSLLDFVLDKYRDGQLIGGQSATTQTRLITLIESLYCLVGLPAPDISLEALGDDGAIGVAEAGSGTTTIVNTAATVGAQVPPEATTTTTLVTITRLPDSPGPLNTRLDQYPAYYEVTSSPPVTFAQDVIIGICPVDDFMAPDFARLKVGHNVGESGFELLPRVDATFLSPTNCSSFIGAVNRGAGVLNLVMRGMSRFANTVLLPEYAHAGAVGTCCLGGSVKTFSPFGAVDTVVYDSAVSPTSISGFPGGTVVAGNLPSVKVVTPTGVPLEGLIVTFSVPVGSGGTISGPVQVTNASGIATVTAWTLGGDLSPDSVRAVVTPPHAGSGVDPNSIVFVATIIDPVVVPYRATGYKYKAIGNNSAPTGFELPGFSTAYWSTGGAPFASGGSCPLNTTSPKVTFWAKSSKTHAAGAYGANSDILLRKTFTVPAGWTGGLTIDVAIDNDVQVYVNGTNVTASAGATMIGYFAIHDGCPTQPTLTFTAASGLLTPGASNLIAVRARDRGVESYFDMKVTLGP